MKLKAWGNHHEKCIQNIRLPSLGLVRGNRGIRYYVGGGRMSDLVKRLRSVQFADVAQKYTMIEAADEIDKLEKFIYENVDPFDTYPGNEEMLNNILQRYSQ